MEELDPIYFEGEKYYPLYEIYVNDEIGTVLISNEELNKALEDALSEEGWSNRKSLAYAIDEDIFCYVPDEILDTNDEETVVKFIIENIL